MRWKLWCKTLSNWPLLLCLCSCKIILYQNKICYWCFYKYWVSLMWVLCNSMGWAKVKYITRRGTRMTCHDVDHGVTSWCTNEHRKDQPILLKCCKLKLVTCLAQNTSVINRITLCSLFSSLDYSTLELGLDWIASKSIIIRLNLLEILHVQYF